MSDDEAAHDSKRARVSDAQGDVSHADKPESSRTRSDSDNSNGSAASSTLMTLEDEFGEMAFLLGDPVGCANPPAAALELATVVASDPAAVRENLRAQATALAGSCSCTTPMGMWTKARPHETPTCGLQQADVVAGVDMEAVFKRQQERPGDNVPYVLARTVRSNIQYEASILIGARGVGNQADRGACMKRAMSMFAGTGMEGVPRDVVLALMRG